MHYQNIPKKKQKKSVFPFSHHYVWVSIWLTFVFTSLFFSNSLVFPKIPSFIGVPDSFSTFPKASDAFDTVLSSYNIYYEIQNGSKSSDELSLDMNITGSDLFYENGTILYQLSKNLDNPTILNALSLVFNEEQISFFENHSRDESFQTSFSYRREAYGSENIDFDNNSYYSLFWLNSSDRPANYLRSLQKIPFLDVQDPIQLTLQPEHPDVASPNWSPESRDLARNVPILATYYLYLNYNNLIRLKLYYDMTWSQLLRAEIDYTNENDEAITYSIRISLESTSLSLNFADTNPYWEARKQTIQLTLLIGGGSLIVISPIVVLVFRKMRKRHATTSQKSKSDSILDRI